ncbi:hypothetical protein [Peribacillus butanolivorans]|uniref:hypothetical protein n=1 Tax=Peribacillus butanolivorans TaxID=421767 RepID=UPI00366E0E9D
MRSVNASEVVAASKFNRFHLFVFLWCFYAIAFDGYVRHRDVWGRLAMDDGGVGSLSSIQAGAIASYSLVGMMLGVLPWWHFCLSDWNVYQISSNY